MNSYHSKVLREHTKAQTSDSNRRVGTFAPLIPITRGTATSARKQKRIDLGGPASSGTADYPPRPDPRLAV
eukprot:GSA25T00003776001.1